MPDPTLSQAIKEAYASAPAGVVTHHTLEMRHPSFTQPIRVVRNKTGLSAALEIDAPANPGEWVDFTGFGFDFLPPDVTEAADPEFVVELDNVSGDIEANIKAAIRSGGIIKCTYRPYLSTDLTGPQMDPPMHFSLKNVVATMLRVTGRATFGAWGNRRFPGEMYTMERFPSLIR